MGVSQREVDLTYMALAFELAQQASLMDEVPVGAVIVSDGKVIGQGHNQAICCHDPSAHAEVVAIRSACKNTSNYRLTGSTMYVTMEPCIMCAGAILHSRIDRLVFAAFDEKFGACGSLLNLLESKFLNHQCKITSGVMALECGNLLSAFFTKKRAS